MFRVDNHSHIILAHIREMVTAAGTKDLTDLSITEHVSQFRELRESVKFGSVHNTGRIFESLREYEMEFGNVGDLARETKVHKGLEVDFHPRFESRIADFVKRATWDIILLSVHEFENSGDIEGRSTSTSKHAPYSRWREYFELEGLALESNSVPFDILAHPVRMSRGLDAHPADIETLLLELATAARIRGKALELNGKDIDYSPALVRMLAIACSKAGCKVSLGSDAHHPREVDNNLETARKLVDEFKLEQFVPKTSR